MAEGRNLMLPGNPRYQPPALRPFWGYDNLYRAIGRVEIANLRALGGIGVIPYNEIRRLTPKVCEGVLDIPTTLIDKVERTETKHDILAWKACANQIIPAPLNRWTHTLLTSYDPISTGQSFQFLQVHKQVVRPGLERVIKDMAEVVKLQAHQLQCGRTHGQAALPITVGFWIATILSRVMYNAKKMDACAKDLVGCISGAVGAYNAQVGLGIMAKCGEESYENRVLGRLGLRAGPISTQIVAPETLAYYLQACCMQSAALGQFGRDCRHLMRSEIGEVSEAGGSSSTMAHKTNPTTFENTEGMWHRNRNEIGKVWDTLISEHQRDLVGSSLLRDLPIIVVNLVVQIDTLLKKAGDPGAELTFLERIVVHPEACVKNFEKFAHLVLSEPLYIALQMAGYRGNGHTLVNKILTPRAKESGRHLVDELRLLAETDAEAEEALDNMPVEVFRLLRKPEEYTGLAPKLAMQTYERAMAFKF